MKPFYCWLSTVTKPFNLLVCTHEPKGANIDRKDINITVIETNLEINVEDVINAFHVTNRVYFIKKRFRY